MYASATGGATQPPVRATLECGAATRPAALPGADALTSWRHRTLRRGRLTQLARALQTARDVSKVGLPTFFPSFDSSPYSYVHLAAAAFVHERRPRRRRRSRCFPSQGAAAAPPPSSSARAEIFGVCTEGPTRARPRLLSFALQNLQRCAYTCGFLAPPTIIDEKRAAFLALTTHGSNGLLFVWVVTANVAREKPLRV